MSLNVIKLMNRGFTLIELLITIVLLVGGFSAILRALSIGMFIDSDVEKFTIALYLAQEKLEEIKDSSSYANIDTFATARASLGAGFTEFDREVTVAGDPKRVDVNVYWSVKGEDQNVQLVTLFADYDY